MPVEGLDNPPWQPVLFLPPALSPRGLASRGDPTAAMEALRHLIDIFLHLDKHLQPILETYGGWTYLLLFVIVFCETGLVVTPFLSGDSLLFAAGAFAAAGSLSVWALLAILMLAAVAGDTINY